MILIGIGANLPSPRCGEPRATCGAALTVLAAAKLSIVARSRWYKSPPMPPSGQPWYVNAVVRIQTALDPVALLSLLLATERAFGRRRGAPNEARVLDLDLLAYGEMAMTEPARDGRPALTLPHPRIEGRPFVLLPLRDVAPDWRHPATGKGLDELIQALPENHGTEPLADAAGAFGTEWDERAPGGGPENG